MSRHFALFAVAFTVGVATSLSAQARPGSTDRTVWPEEGPPKWAPRPTETAITANDLRTRLYQFADDSMMGRRIGEPGNTKGTDYIAREFVRLGLKPGGDSGSWFQTLPWGPTAFDSATSRLVAGGRALRSKTEWIPLTPATQFGIGPRAEISNARVAYAGRWGDTVALDPAVFRGKVAVFSGGPMIGGAGGGRSGAPSVLARCDSLPDRFGADAAIALETAQRAARGVGGGRAAGTGRGGRSGATPADTRAETAGAIGTLFVGLGGLPESVIRGAFTGRMGMAPAGQAAASGLPAAAISEAAAARLFGRPVSQVRAGSVGQTVTAAWRHSWRPASSPANNVIAILPGSDPARAGEYVLVGAHNDHVGISSSVVEHDSLRAVNTVTRRQGANDPTCRPTADQQHRINSLVARARSIRPPRRDSVMNGADDDGSGTVLMLEIAERFARERPARSIIFVSHQGEEGGLRGSRWFTENPTVPLANVVAAINMDMVGKGRVTEVKFGGPASVQMLGARRLSREFGDIIDSVNAVRSEVMAIDKSWDVTANPLNRFCRSDQVNYVRKNIPVVYVSLGYSQDYHQATDEPQYVDYDHGARLGRFVYDIMWAVSERRNRPVITGPDPAYPSC
ncbi:MAG TPA: M28 family peptidase [Gemmatimonadaceae bacterium]